MLAKITIICFAASYAVALLMEVSRLFFRLPVRLVAILAFAVAGLFAHTVFLWNQAQPGIASGVPLSSWYLWLLMAAWCLAAVYLVFAAARPQTSMGIFMLPVVLGLIAAAQLSDPESSFPRDQAIGLWGMVHGVTLLLGTVTAALGFVAGVMYLVQSYRLKHKLPPKPGLRLPSLEWLQSLNKYTLYLSVAFVAAGVFAGVIWNVIRAADEGTQAVPWTDRVIVSSGGLMAWLLAATLFELFYKPAQQGRKIAYLTVANFLFLAAVLSMVLLGGTKHAQPNAKAGPQASASLQEERR